MSLTYHYDVNEDGKPNLSVKPERGGEFLFQYRGEAGNLLEFNLKSSTGSAYKNAATEIAHIDMILSMFDTDNVFFNTLDNTEKSVCKAFLSEMRERAVQEGYK